MNNRIITYLVGFVILGMGLLLTLNFFQMFQPTNQAKYISPNEVRGIATEHDSKLYTLNFDQQNKFVTLLNRSVQTSIDQSKNGQSEFDFDKVIIYRFDKPNIIITPISVLANQLLFSSNEWNPNGLLRETGPGELKTLLDTTYDK